MVTYVLDASAIIRLLDREPGFSHVRRIISASNAGSARMVISAVNWGEVIYYIRKRRDAAATQRLAQRLIDFGLTVISATSVRAERAAYLRLRYKISYADAYGVELTQDSPDHILVTADYGVKSAEHDIQIEFLPTKPTP